jgi:hypothetical protein
MTQMKYVVLNMCTVFGLTWFAVNLFASMFWQTNAKTSRKLQLAKYWQPFQRLARQIGSQFFWACPGWQDNLVTNILGLASNWKPKFGIN